MSVQSLYMGSPWMKYSKIIEMAKEDIEEILDIANLCFKSPWTRNLFEQERDLEYSRIFVIKQSIKDRRSILGYICFWLVIDEAHILNLATHPNFRRQGIAASLISSCLESSIHAGAKNVTLEVRKSNLPAISAYKQFGFKAKGIRPRYYSDNLEDAIVMWLRLDSYDDRLCL